MSSGQDRLQARVNKAGEELLAAHGYVCAIDMFQRIGWLERSAVEDWRRGRVPCLERVVQSNLSKLLRVLQAMRRWALGRGLKPSERVYKKWGRGATHELRFSLSGSPYLEKLYRTHYVSKAGKKSAVKPEAPAVASKVYDYDRFVDCPGDEQVGGFIPELDSDKDAPF